MGGGFVSSAFLFPPLRGIECLSPKPLLLLLGAEMEAALIVEGSGGEAISRFSCPPLFGGRQKSAVHFSLKKLRAQGDELSMRRFWELCLLPDFLLPPYLGVGVRIAGSFTRKVESLSCEEWASQRGRPGRTARSQASLPFRDRYFTRSRL